MEQDWDFDFSSSPIVSYPDTRIKMATAAAIKNLELFGMDVSNYFYSDTIKPEDCLWLESPI